MVNRGQRVVIAVGITAILAMLLFPPFQFNHGGKIASDNMGYSFILTPPQREGTYYGSIPTGTVNGRLLLLQWSGVLILTGMGYLLFTKK